MRALRPLCRQSGAAAVELAIVMVFLLLVLAGIVEFGRAFWYYDALTKATRDGARMLSVVEKASFGAAAVDAAKSLVVDSVNTARLNPALTTGNVAVTCLDASFSSVACAGGAATPANVRVAITGYTVDIGGMIPFLSPGGGGTTTFTGIALSPATTMRYMK